MKNPMLDQKYMEEQIRKHTVPSPETDRRLKALEKLPEDVNELKITTTVIKSTLDNHTDAHGEILKQVTYTNGRVRWLEKMIYLALGALIILTPICTWFIKDYINFKQTYSDELSQTIYDVLDHYEFELE